MSGVVQYLQHAPSAPHENSCGAAYVHIEHLQPLLHSAPPLLCYRAAMPVSEQSWLDASYVSTDPHCYCLFHSWLLSLLLLLLLALLALVFSCCDLWP